MGILARAEQHFTVLRNNHSRNNKHNAPGLRQHTHPSNAEHGKNLPGMLIAGHVTRSEPDDDPICQEHLGGCSSWLVGLKGGQ